MRTRHLVGLISGVLILSVLLPVGLSIWLAHQQVETSFIEELNTYSSRDVNQRLPHRTQIAHPVVDDGNRGAPTAHQSAPLVEGIWPAARSSDSMATRSALSKALNTVSD